MSTKHSLEQIIDVAKNVYKIRNLTQCTLDFPTNDKIGEHSFHSLVLAAGESKRVYWKLLEPFGLKWTSRRTRGPNSKRITYLTRKVQAAHAWPWRRGLNSYVTSKLKFLMILMSHSEIIDVWNGVWRVWSVKSKDGLLTATIANWEDQNKEEKQFLEVRQRRRRPP